MVKNIFIKKFAGFSMLEASVTMLIVGIFVAMCANAYTKRHVTYQEADGHGRYECYRNAAGIVQRYVENNSAREVAGATCVFRPPRYAKYFLINVSGGGTAAAAGKFDSLFFTSFQNPITITPGAAGNPTTLSVNGRTIHSTAAGGGPIIVTNAETVEECTLINPLYNCLSTMSCYQDGTDIVVNYCSDITTLSTVTLPLADVKQYRRTASGDTLTYQDLSPYTNLGYTMEGASQQARSCIPGSTCYDPYYVISLKFKMQNSQESQMVNYISALGITDGIATVDPGALGNAGAVLILW